MKTKSHPSRLFALFAVILCLGFTGCVSSNAAKKFAQFEALGITEATITGKFSNTEYKVEREGGVRRATLDHSNAWLPKVHIVRETEEAPKD
jgi:hypothetical protein